MLPPSIHQIWVDDINKLPTDNINSWKCENITYKLWTIEDINDNKSLKKLYYAENTSKNDKISLIALEIIRLHGGIYIDTDLVKTTPLDFNLLLVDGFISNDCNLNIFGFIKNSKLCSLISSCITSNKQNLIKKIISNSGIRFVSNISFSPCTNDHKYLGHEKIYAMSSKFYENYKNILVRPTQTISIILINNQHLDKNMCLKSLKSIMDQEGHFNIEVVWVNNMIENSNQIKQMLLSFESQCRYLTVKYIEMVSKKNINQLQKNAYNKCTGEIIVYHDLKNFMAPLKIQKQCTALRDTDFDICLTASNNFEVLNNDTIRVLDNIPEKSTKSINTLAVKKSSLNNLKLNNTNIYESLTHKCKFIDEPLLLQHMLC
tara:strand:+ start:3578 stop:4702 length:1125 start_codon:yes stop_codon:yes gene_type:complete